MQNRFGLKDFILLVCVLAVLGLVLLSMVQEDRRFQKVQVLESKITNLEQQQARIQSTLDRGVIASVPGGQRPTGSGPQSRDTSWARPGVEIQWQPDRVHDAEPEQAQGFAAGGEVTELFPAQMSTIVPLIYKDVYGAYVFERVTEYLAEWNPRTLELRGVLAGAWQYAPDGTWLRVRIRDNARFSDGQPVTADDVLWTFEWMRNPQVQAERSRSVTDFITSLTKVDDRTVEFTFGQVLFTNMSAAMGTFPILPKHFYEKFTPTQFNQATGLVMGSGPFKLERLDPEDQWTPGTDVVLVRNEMYWGPRPAFDRLRFRVVRDDLARITSFNNGEGDITTPSAPQFARLSQDSAWKSRNTPHMWYNIRGGYNFIGWNCGLRNGKPTVFADKRVRRAMTHLLDRELISRQLFENLARPSSGPFNSETAQSNPEIRPWPFSMDEARRLLAEAGWQDRDRNGVLEDAEGREFAFEFTYAVGSEVTEKLAKYLKDQCALVGIRVSLRGMDWSVFMKAMDDRDFDALTLGWSPASPESDPQQIWHSRFIENQGDNFVQWKHPEVDRLIEEGRRELDQSKRMQYWHRLHAIIHEEQPYTFLVERPWLRVVNNRVGNFVEYRNGFQYDELFVRSGGGAARTTP